MTGVIASLATAVIPGGAGAAGPALRQDLLA